MSTLSHSVVNLVAYGGSYLWILVRAALRGETLGTVFMNVGLFGSAQVCIQGLASSLSELYQNTIYLEDYLRLCEITPEIEEDVHGVPLKGPVLSIAFENVSFSYPGSKRCALRNASFELDNGEMVYFVGGNGAGKSTAIKLLLRLYNVDSGRITINGRDIRDYSVARLRSELGALMRDFMHYHLSIRENVVVGDLSKADNGMLIEEALGVAGLKGKVRSLPMDVDTYVGRAFEEGEDLSIGEWQKLGLARVALRSAPVVILDEPTSALDAKMEESIFEYFRDGCGRDLTIVVSHRLSGARYADKIVAFDDGRVVAIGKHEELIRTDNVYTRLFRTQQKRYLGAATLPLEAMEGTGA